MSLPPAGSWWVQLCHPLNAQMVRGSLETADPARADDTAGRTIPGLVVYRFSGPLIFANVRFFIERIESFIAKEVKPVREIILDARAIPSIDLTAAELSVAVCWTEKGLLYSE